MKTRANTRTTPDYGVTGSVSEIQTIYDKKFVKYVEDKHEECKNGGYQCFDIYLPTRYSDFYRDMIIEWCSENCLVIVGMVKEKTSDRLIREKITITYRINRSVTWNSCKNSKHEDREEDKGEGEEDDDDNSV